MGVIQAHLCRSQYHPGNDSDQAGGQIVTSQRVLNAVRGEILPRLTAKATGTLGVNVERQHQQAGFWVPPLGHADNPTGSTLHNCLIYIANLLLPPSTPARLKARCTSATDAGKKLIADMLVDGSITTDELVLTGTTLASALKTLTKLLRVRVVNPLTGELVRLDGDVEIYIGDFRSGTIPGRYSWATGQLEVWVPSSTDTNILVANRRLAPVGALWTQPNSRENALWVRNNSANASLGPNVSQLFWLREALEPGEETTQRADFLPILEGDTD